MKTNDELDIEERDRDIQRLEDERNLLRKVLEELLSASESFAEEVRRDTGKAYPWPALDIAAEKARALIGNWEDRTYTHHPRSTTMRGTGT